MGCEPIFENDRRRQRIDGVFLSAHPALRRKPFTRFDAGKALVRLVDRKIQMRAQVRAEFASTTHHRTFGPVHTEWQTHDELCDFSPIDRTGNLFEISL